jgi:peptidoglycan/LPS O-acetylase OafA/YrhL
VGKDLLDKIQPLQFRKDINFLRALSVVSVIIYHIDKSLLPGGWLGVDIFFFISGYLISSTIINELKNNNFQFRNFYLKRIKRILPALLSTLIFTIPFAFFLLPPRELYLYINSFQSSLLFYSNLYFENLDFYNSPSTKFFPLLHMWSLSVEEQFYIIFPFVLFFIFKFRKNSTFIYIVVFSVLSLFLNSLDIGNLVFYQIQFRIWEFLFGVIFMFLESRISFKKNNKYIGIFIIFFSFIFFDDSIINNFYTKLICLIGVFLYLINSNENRLIFFLNNNKFIQQIGLISFSLYLFHQPIFVFFRIYDTNINNVSSFTYIGLVIFLYVISYLNWKYIEVPYQKSFLRNKKFILGLVFIGLCASTLTLLNQDSFINRFTNIPTKALLLSFKNQDTISQNGLDCDNRSIENTCVFVSNSSKENIYVIGDSSLRTLSTALLEYQNNNFNLIHLGGDDCMYLIGEKLNSNSCPNKNIEEMNKFVKNINNSIIIYGGRLPRYLSGTGFDNSFVAEDNDIKVIDNFESKVIYTIETLASKNQVILLYPIPEQGWNVPELYFYNKFKWGDTISYPSSVWSNRVQDSKLLLNSVNNKNIFRVYPENIFCDSFVKSECVGAFNAQIFYSDDDHLSLEGSRLLAKEIIKILKIK